MKTSKKSSRSESASSKGRERPAAAGFAEADAEVGQGGEVHQRGGARLTTNHGVPLSDNQNSLRAGEIGRAHV